jgi:hypothetical protein
LRLDGSTNTVTTSIPITTTPALSNFSYEIWTSITAFPAALTPNVYNRTYQSGVLLGAAYYSGAALYWYGNTAGDACTMYGYIRGNDGYRNTPGFDMALNTIYHFVLVNNYSGNAIQLYVNGTLYGSTTAATQEYNAGLAASAGNIGIALSQVDGGGESNYRPYSGVVYSARVYQTALTAAQVNQNYNALKNKYNFYEPVVVRNGLSIWIDAGNYIDSTIVDDLSGKSNNGRIIARPTYTASPARFNFDGTSQYILATLNPALGSFNTTLECWVNITLNSKGPFLYMGGSTEGYGIGIGASDFTSVGNNLIVSANFSFTGSRYTFTSSGWAHIVCSLGANTSTWNLYVNGVNVLANFTQGVGAASSQVYISYDNTYYGANPVAVGRIYNRVLSLTEIQQNYNATRGRFGI